MYICPKTCAMRHLAIICILLTGTFFSCGGGGNKKSLSKIQVKLLSEGPLYNGSNTATGIWKPEIGTEVRSVRFTGITVSGSDTSLSGLAGNLVLQLAAPKSEMKKIAFHQGPAKSNQISLQLASEQDGLSDFFNGQEVTFVIDYDFIPDELNENLSFNLEFDAELTTSK